MTSTPNSASTARMLRQFATRRPEWFAVLTGAAYGPPLLAIELLGQERDQMSITAGPVLLSQIAWCVLVPAVLLTTLGWWGTAGFTRRSTWRSLIPFLPLILLFAVLPLMGWCLDPGVASHSPGYPSLAALTMLAVGFGEEATFRGVVLQTLLPRGRMRAVLLSSVLYGVASIGVISSGRYPVLAGVQAPATRWLFAAPTRSRMRVRGASSDWPAHSVSASASCSGIASSNGSTLCSPSSWDSQRGWHS